MAIFQKIKKPCVRFSRFGRVPQLCRKCLRKFSKISLKKAQNALFWSILKRISKPCVKSSRAWTKNNSFENFLENFQRFL